MAASPTPPQLSLRVDSEIYDPNDDRWLSQVQTLLKELDEDVGPVRQEVTPIAGQKGGAVEIILALGTAGAFPAAIAVFNSWLKRDKSRSITLEFDGPDGKRTVKISGEGLTEEMMKDLIARAVK